MFKDRQQAGQLLAEKLNDFSAGNFVILGLARGGMVVARPVAKKLKAPLDVLVVKKIPSPLDAELAIGALAPNKIEVINEDLIQDVDQIYLETKIGELNRKVAELSDYYHQKYKSVNVDGKKVILVDDGLATGASAEAAIAWCKSKKPEKIILAVPVGSPEAVEKLKNEVDELVVLETHPDLGSVGQYYEDFREISESDVLELLNEENLKK